MAVPRLHVIDTQGRRTIVVDKPVFSVGRRSTSDLQVVGTDVSREHIEICTEDDRFVLRDQGSRFGTFVNGDPVTERALVHGDRIRLGRSDSVELRFMFGDLEDTQTDQSSGVADLRQIAALLDGLRALGSGRVLDEVLVMVLDLALDVTSAERGFIMLANEDGELEFTVARARGRVKLSGRVFETSLKIPRQVYETGRSQFVSDLMEGSLASAHEGTIALGIRQVLCVPLRVVPYSSDPSKQVEARLIGVLYLDGKGKGALENRTTRTALETFATQAALAIDSARLYAESAEKARLDRDLQIAADIQRTLLPDATFSCDAFELAAVSIPCRTIGGDFYDYLQLPDARFGIGLADVAGKGPPAALLTVFLQSVFAAHVPVSEGPAQTLDRVNRALLRRAVEARFATMFHGLIHGDGRLEYCAAGHEPPVLVRASGEAESLEEGGLVLGLFEHATYEAGTVQLAAGDVLVVSSDGVTEARSATDEEYGRDRVETCVREYRHLDAQGVLDALLEDIERFTAGAPQADDLTAMVLKYRGQP